MHVLYRINIHKSSSICEICEYLFIYMQLEQCFVHFAKLQAKASASISHGRVLASEIGFAVTG